MLRRIAIAAAFLLAVVPRPNAMNFIWRDQLTVRASGPIEKGDATKFAALPKFDTLETALAALLARHSLSLQTWMRAEVSEL